MPAVIGMPPESISKKADVSSANRHSPHHDHNKGENHPKASSSSSSSPSSSSKVFERAESAKRAALDVEGDFDDYSSLRNDIRAAMVASFDPEELLFESSSVTATADGRFSLYILQGISLSDPDGREPPFSDEMEDTRERFSDRSHHEAGQFSIKFVNPHVFEKSTKAAEDAACALVIESKILMNLPKHPHICQIYGMNAEGAGAGFGSCVIQENFFVIIDAISETLPDRIRSWRKKKAYHEGEKFDDLEQRQSEVTQRLEVALDIISAVSFLSGCNLVYFLHPEKVAFGKNGVKLHDFGHSQESGEMPLFQFDDERDMSRRVYFAPEVLRGGKATVSVDVYAAGLLLWEILVLKPPFHGMKHDQHMKDVVEGNSRPHLSRTFPENLRNLIEECWAPSLRPSIKQVHGRLEELLLEGVELKDGSNDKDLGRSTSRRIKYENDKDTNDEERDRDLKSTRSKESARSKVSSHHSKKVTSNHDGDKHRSSRNQKIRYNRDEETSSDDRDHDSKSLRSKETARSNGSRKSKSSHTSRKSTNSNEMENSDKSNSRSRSNSVDKDILRSKRSSRKIKYEKEKERPEDHDRDTKSLKSRETAKSRETTRSRVSTRSGGSGEAPSRKSKSFLSRPSEDKNHDTTDRIQALRERGASRRKLSSDLTKSEDEKIPLADSNTPSRSMSSRHVSSRQATSNAPRSLSRERLNNTLAPDSKTPFAVHASPFTNRRNRLARAMSEEILFNLTGDDVIDGNNSEKCNNDNSRSSSKDVSRPTSASSSENIKTRGDISARRPARRTATATSLRGARMVLGDPSRQGPPPRSKSADFVQPIHLPTKSPSALTRTKSSDGVDLAAMATSSRAKLTPFDGHSSAEFGTGHTRRQQDPENDKRGKLQATPSGGGLIQASTKDTVGSTARARARISSREKDKSEQHRIEYNKSIARAISSRHLTIT